MENLWLKHFNFRFDPFKHGEASQDPYLNRYLIGYDSFSVAWSETPALIFSPPGGGKTALRIYTSRACWSGGGGYQPFPIHYHLPHYFKKGDFSTLEEHLEQIVHSGANALFIAFAYYPLIFLNAAPSLQKQLTQFILTWIPNVDFYLDVLREGQPDDVAGQLDSSYILHQAPDPTLLKLFRENFSNFLEARQAPISLSIQKVFERLANWITTDLGFRSVYLLVDGVDGFPELASSPGFAAQSLVNLFANAPEWVNSRIYIKGFLPLEIRSHLQEGLKGQWSEFSEIHLKWNEEMLAELIRQRVYAATASYFKSLNAVSALPPVWDLEIELAGVVNPLPREMMKIVRQLLTEYETRWQENPESPKQILSEDLNAVIAWYRTDQAHITKELASIAQG